MGGVFACAAIPVMDLDAPPIFSLMMIAGQARLIKALEAENERLREKMNSDGPIPLLAVKASTLYRQSQATVSELQTSLKSTQDELQILRSELLKMTKERDEALAVASAAASKMQQLQHSSCMPLATNAPPSNSMQVFQALTGMHIVQEGTTGEARYTVHTVDPDSMEGESEPTSGHMGG